MLSPELSSALQELITEPDKVKKFGAISHHIFSKFLNYYAAYLMNTKVENVKCLIKIIEHLAEEKLLSEYVHFLKDYINGSWQKRYNYTSPELVYYILLSCLTQSEIDGLGDFLPSKPKKFHENSLVNIFASADREEVKLAGVKFPRHFIFGDNTGLSPLSRSNKIILLAYCEVEDFTKYVTKENLPLFLQDLKAASSHPTMYNVISSISRCFVTSPLTRLVEYNAITTKAYCKFLTRALEYGERRVLQSHLGVDANKCPAEKAPSIIERCDHLMRLALIWHWQNTRDKFFIENIFEKMPLNIKTNVINSFSVNCFEDWDFDKMIRVLNIAKKSGVKLDNKTGFGILQNIRNLDCDIDRKEFGLMHDEEHSSRVSYAKDESLLLKMWCMYRTFYGEYKTANTLPNLCPDKSQKKLKQFKEGWSFTLNSAFHDKTTKYLDSYLSIADFIHSYPARHNLMLVCKSWYDYYNTGATIALSGMEKVLELISPRTLNTSNEKIAITNTDILKCFKYASHSRSAVELEVNGIWRDVFRVRYCTFIIHPSSHETKKHLESAAANGLAWRHYHSINKQVEASQPQQESQQRQ